MTLGFSGEVQRARAIALDRFRRMNAYSTVHGDVNLRNILLQGDRISYLIDYACSGPGHPAVDLARLELSLYLGPFQQSGSDEECRALQTALSIERCDVAALSAQFPGMLKLRINRVYIDGCVKARDAALQMVRVFGGDERDYLVAKLLLAWYALALEGLNSGLARGVIEVISEEVLKWNN